MCFQSRNFSATIFSASKASFEVANANSASYAISSIGMCRYPKRSQLSAYARKKVFRPQNPPLNYVNKFVEVNCLIS